VDFIGGGHDLRYKFIPNNQIWIEKNITNNELPKILVHEITERNLMSRGLSYEKAHEHANLVESYYRKHPKHPLMNRIF
jgi:hypothetical protein